MHNININLINPLRIATITGLLLWSASFAEWLYAREPIPEKLVVLTFDDSAKSHFTVVRPILMQYGLGATFFVTEGYDFRDNKQDYMTWEQIAQLHRDGFEIGNHTRDHLSINDDNAMHIVEQVEGIQRRCAEYGIPAPISFAWPGNAMSLRALDKLSELGIRFARRGGAPEWPYQAGRGFAYEPYLDHPLLIPSAGDSRPDWEQADFIRAVQQATRGRIAVLQFHGVPDSAHSWVNTPQHKFQQYMHYLAVNDYQVIAMRDLERFIDPTVTPKDPLGVIEDRQAVLASGNSYDDFRKPAGDLQIKFWLANMLVDHRYTLSEAAAITGMSADEIHSHAQRLSIDTPVPLPEGRLRVLPYPGGRHPRTGFRDGAIRPQRESKLSVFLPWEPRSYVVVDVPEAIWWMQEERRELLFLAHTHIKTTWDQRGVRLPAVEWQQTESGWQVERQLPDGIAFGALAQPHENELLMKLWLRNGSDKLLSGLAVQNCVMLAGAPGFDGLTNDNKVLQKPFAACCDASGQRWIVTGWQACGRAWANPPCPCMHSDPQFPDCPPGETRELLGVISFYVGSDVNVEFERLRSQFRM
ncbi:MAG: polysaccharide deacetylase family protein [Pirellulaceae bacterium]|nr:polysaccharide deacetylase family protein [Pirellulaceae bacterium]